MIKNLGLGEHEHDIIKFFKEIVPEYEEFKNIKSCLQIGCRSAKSFRNFALPFMRMGCNRNDLLEAYEKNVNGLKLPEINNKIHGNGLKIASLVDNSYNIIIWHHGPEHITKQQFIKVLSDIMSLCNILVIGCPHGEYKQGELYGNPFEKHQAHWLATEFEQMGFDMYTFGSGQPHKREMMMGVLTKTMFNKKQKEE